MSHRLWKSLGPFAQGGRKGWEPKSREQSQSASMKPERVKHCPWQNTLERKQVWARLGGSQRCLEYEGHRVVLHC